MSRRPYRPYPLLGVLCCALTVAAACDNISTCPRGTLERKGECFELPDAGGDMGGASNGDANGQSNGETNQGQNGGDMDSGPMDAGSDDAGASGGSTSGTNMDSGMMAMPDAQVDAGPEPCVPSVPSTEVCNGRDDDCNGKADEGLLVASAATTKQWDLSAAMTLPSERGLSALLPRAGGGAYFLYKHLPTSDAASSLSVVRFDPQGALVPFPAAAPQVDQTQTGLLPTARTFLAASYGSYVAIMYFEPDGDGQIEEAVGATKLSLWKEDATDGLLKQVGTSIELLAVNADMTALSVIPGPAGSLRILATYSSAEDNTVNGTGATHPPLLHVFQLAAGALALAPVANPVTLTRAVSGMADVIAGATVRIVPDPCGAGWLIGYFDPPSQGSTVDARETYLRTLSVEGVLGSVIWSSGKGYTFQGLGIEGQCLEKKSRLLLALGDASAVEARELLWTRDSTGATSGTATETGRTPLESSNSVVFTQILNQRGAWFLTYRTFGGVRGLWELDVATDTLRTIALPIDPGPLSSVGMDVRDTNMYFVPTQSLVPLASGPFVTFSNASSNKTLDPVANPLGSETAAVTYQLACP